MGGRLADTGWRAPGPEGAPVVWGGDRLYVLAHGAWRPVVVDVYRRRWRSLPDPPGGWGGVQAASAVWTGDGLLTWRRVEPPGDRPWLRVALWRPGA